MSFLVNLLCRGNNQPSPRGFAAFFPEKPGKIKLILKAEFDGYFFDGKSCVPEHQHRLFQFLIQ